LINYKTNKDMKRNWKVRFHLGKGDNFMKWRIENVETKEVTFYSPDKVMISMIDCKLHNHKGTAKKINEGQNKTVCAWIMCKNVNVIASQNYSFEKFIHEEGMTNVAQYNPRVTPYWRDQDDNNIDKHEYRFMLTYGTKLLTKNK
tara:strand:- start:110 stop:544 length:435 start_codon:yes stop_codon:yes gene_type:complete